jgi:hypothetical protein
MSKIAVNSPATGTATFTLTAPGGTSTDRTLTLPDNTGTVITSASTTGLNASALSTGTVPTARLGSGTANNTTFLRGDGSWQVINTTPTTDQVLTATAGASVGAVGTYALLRNGISSSFAEGTTTSGSLLQYINAAGDNNGAAPAGTWRCMGRASSFAANASAVTLWLRIS